MKDANVGLGSISCILKLMSAALVLTLTVKLCLPTLKGSVNGGLMFLAEKNSVSAETETSARIKDILPAKPLIKEKDSVAENFEIPEDIIQMEKEYLDTFSAYNSAGTIKEAHFETSGATDILGGIAIRNAVNGKKPDFAALIKKRAKLHIKDKSQPTVLIFHTHTTESYLLSDNGFFYDEFKTRSENSDRNMVRIGCEICKALEAEGIGVIHDTEIHDKSYNEAYRHSRKSLLKYLDEYPSIQITLDVHRDAVYYSDSSRCKPIAEINGKKAAQIMLLTGAEGDVKGDFPNWEDNLRFALEIQKKAQETYPGLMKPIFFCQRKYNMDVTGNSLLIEVGTDANALHEAVYSASLLGRVLADMVNGHTGKNNDEK